MATYEPGRKTIQLYMKLPSNLYKTYWNTIMIARNKTLASHHKQFYVIQSLSLSYYKSYQLLYSLKVCTTKIFVDFTVLEAPTTIYSQN